jgi:hypothetical protein
MLEKYLAAFIATVCVALLIRLLMPQRYRWRLDATVREAWAACRAWAVRLWRWRSSRQSAARMAEEAIRRARSSVEKDGNVYRPKSFRQPTDSKEPRKPH